MPSQRVFFSRGGFPSQGLITCPTVESIENGLAVTEDQAREMRDATRADAVAKVVGDVLWRFNEEHEEAITVYDVIGMVVEDLIVQGMCPACLASAIDVAYANTNAARDVHITDDQAVRRQNNSDVFH